MRKDLKVVSATQISLFRQCPRLWIERYLFGHKLPSTPEMDEGLEVHQAIENYLKTGKLEHGKWPNVLAKVDDTLKALDLVDGTGKPKAGVFAEKPVRVKIPGGPWFTGSMDIWDTRGDMPTILDTKSKNSFNYILTEYQLVDDIQLCIYALYVMEKMKVEQVRLKHIYVLRDEKQPEVKEVKAVVTLEQVRKVFHEDIVPVVAKMVEYAGLDMESSLAVEGNDASCISFGKPCHYIEQCEPQSDLVGLRVPKKSESTDNQEESTMANDEGMLEELRRKKAEKAGKPTTKATPATELSALDKVRAAIASGAIKFDGDNVFAKEGADSGWIMRPASPAELVARDAKPEVAPVATSSILPPDAPSRTTPKPEAAAAAPAAPEPKAAPEAKEEAPKTEKKTKPASKPQTVEPLQGPTVYVGCLPSTRVVALFSDWVRPLEDAVAAKLKLSHWKGAQFIAHAEAAMVVAIREALPSLPTQIFVEGEEPAAKLFLSTVVGADFIRKCF